MTMIRPLPAGRLEHGGPLLGLAEDVPTVHRQPVRPSYAQKAYSEAGWEEIVK